MLSAPIIVPSLYVWNEIVDCVVTDKPENLNFLRMNKKTGTLVQIPIRYYNQTKNREIKLGGFLSTATRYLDVRVKGDVTYVPPFINCNLEKLTHKRAFGVQDLDFDRSKFAPHPKMYKRVFASISGKVKGADDTTEEEASKSIWIVCLQTREKGGGKGVENERIGRKRWEKAVFIRNSERFSVGFIKMTTYPQENNSNIHHRHSICNQLQSVSLLWCKQTRHITSFFAWSAAATARYTTKPQRPPQ